MKVLSYLTLAALLSITACSHHKKCTKEDCKMEKDHKCDDGSCKKDEKKACCSGDSCHKKT
jgi:hypothetical protein